MVIKKDRTVEDDPFFIADPETLHMSGCSGGHDPTVIACLSWTTHSQTVPGVAPGLVPVSPRMPPGAQPMPILVGDTVIFKIHDDPPVYRPLLVIHVVSPTEVDGELFLSYAVDWAYDWPKQNLFVQLNETNRIRQIGSAMFGEEVGQWRPR